MGSEMCIRDRSYISFDAKFYADSESEVKKIFLPTHFRENQLLKNLRGRIQKILIGLNRKLNSDSKYTHKLGDCLSQTLESLMF